MLLSDVGEGERALRDLIDDAVALGVPTVVEIDGVEALFGRLSTPLPSTSAVEHRIQAAACALFDLVAAAQDRGHRTSLILARVRLCLCVCVCCWLLI